MDWDFYKTVLALNEKHHFNETLNVLAERYDSELIPTPLVQLKATALHRLGDTDTAVAELEKVVARGDADQWTWYLLAECARSNDNWNSVFAAYQEAQVLFKWPEGKSNGYRFTHDYFSSNIEKWTEWFSKYITAKPLNALEIGSWQGGSSCWLLDKVIGPRNGQITCIDPFIGSSEHQSFLSRIMSDIGTRMEDVFDDNVKRTGHADKVRKLVGFSSDVLPKLHGEKFDFIYIDGAHEAKFVIQDIALCWGLLKVGGFMLFDDMPYTFKDAPEQNTERAVNFFLSVFAEETKVIDSGRQLLVQRVPLVEV